MTDLDEKSINIFTETEKTEVTILKGDAPKPIDPKPPLKMAVVGVLDAPLKWLEKRVKLHDQLQANIMFSEDDKEIKLTVIESDFYKSGTVVGKLKAHSDKNLWQLNQGYEFDNFQLADLIKMNRSAFENNLQAMELVTTLRNFKAKIDGELEKSDNKRGDMRLLRSQTVDSNLPKAFRIRVGVFKGYPKKTVSVEIEIDSETFRCALVSADYKELEDKMTETEIEIVLGGIREIAPDIAIIEY